ncbi:bifunctional nicotinamidase/pyrazinamidase [Pseudoxanthobacter sp.]|uniref:bifunctional nicotinamidase/pyrazinamidase n=1 Tax=Pseudoxanthobacter sp. TaxID=1925742 RepID=UPI002FE25890
MRFGVKDVLIGVDLQYGFMPGGNLPVADGHAVVPVVNRIAPYFDNVVLTQDWHPPGHWSFASSHPGRKPYEVIRLPYGEQVLWPDHCVQGTHDAELHADLDIPHAQLILRKGYHKAVDSYSAFHAADRTTPTGLASYLHERGITRVVLAGLATDFCVAWTALDARAAGFETLVVEDACRGINVEGSLSNAWDAMKDAGVHRIASADIG